MKRRQFALAALLTLFGSCDGTNSGDVVIEASITQAPPEEPDADAPLVAFLGDSITAGLHVDDEDSFSSVLERRFSERDLPFRRGQAGVSGDTSAGGLRRIEWLLRQSPAVIVIELGGNDGLRGVDLATVEANLRGIIERTQEAGAIPILLGMRIPENYGQYAHDFAAIYPRLAKETGARYLDFFMDGVGAIPEMNTEDQLHPNERGHERLADNLEALLAETLEEAALANR